MPTNTPKDVHKVARDKVRAAKFARAMARNAFGRFYSNDETKQEILRSLAKRPKAIPRHPRRI